ncbi:hypothetical protein BJ875DRAFT_513160 [Amylocarpus encephaloides]|uniref:Uncharacterized protein n=1 Tax=Amylocarpus encephaloides TaxID=45428 RepID=A0A9P7YGM0_9HELO|nr:hypothetical protein BJ875DRAFT_513160 [Amylocarpus encephaloides]
MVQDTTNPRLRIQLERNKPRPPRQEENKKKQKKKSNNDNNNTHNQRRPWMHAPRSALAISLHLYDPHPFTSITITIATPSPSPSPIHPPSPASRGTTKRSPTLHSPTHTHTHHPSIHPSSGISIGASPPSHSGISHHHHARNPPSFSASPTTIASARTHTHTPTHPHVHTHSCRIPTSLSRSLAHDQQPTREPPSISPRAHSPSHRCAGHSSDLLNPLFFSGDAGAWPHFWFFPLSFLSLGARARVSMDEHCRRWGHLEGWHLEVAFRRTAYSI